MRRFITLLCLLAGCTPASEFRDGGEDGVELVYVNGHIDELECRVGIIGSRCMLSGVCELGLECELSGHGDARVCAKKCVDNTECPWATQCMRVFPPKDAGLPEQWRCIRPCKSEEQCSCAGSECVPLEIGGAICR